MNKEIEKAISVLKELQNTGHKKFEVVRGTCYAYIEIQPVLTALEAQQADRWIPITENLPTNCQRLIVCNKSGNMYLSRFRNNEFVDIEYNPFNTCQENTISEVNAWKPIGEPWKEEQP